MKYLISNSLNHKLLNRGFVFTFLLVAGTSLSPCFFPAKAMAQQAGDAKSQQLFFETIATLDTPSALQAGRKFLNDNPNMDSWNRLQFYAGFGSRIYSSAPANDKSQAVEATEAIFDEGLSVAAKEGGIGYVPWTDQKLVLINAKLDFLLAEKKWPEAEKFLAETEPIALATDSNQENRLNDYLLKKVRLLKEQRRSAEIPAVVLKFANKHIATMYRAELPLCEFVADELIEFDRAPEALSWAKLGFLYCNFDDRSISRATQLLTKAWLANDFARDKVTAFANAQTDANAPNPLDSVPLPTLDKTPLLDRLADPAVKEEEKVNLLLLTGQPREAMVQARKALLAESTSERGLRETTLVFKAVDGDFARANQFLNFYQSGQGENPMGAFLKEMATKTPN